MDRNKATVDDRTSKQQEDLMVSPPYYVTLFYQSRYWGHAVAKRSKYAGSPPTIVKPRGTRFNHREREVSSLL